MSWALEQTSESTTRLLSGSGLFAQGILAGPGATEVLLDGLGFRVGVPFMGSGGCWDHYFALLFCGGSQKQIVGVLGFSWAAKGGWGGGGPAGCGGRGRHPSTRLWLREC